MPSQFRVTNIALDDDQNVREITAIAHRDIHKLINDPSIRVAPHGHAEVTLTLPHDAAIRLFITHQNAAPHSKYRQISDSLVHIIYGLMNEAYWDAWDASTRA